MSVRVQIEAFDAGALLSEFSRGRTRSGGIVSFTGLARNATDGQAVATLELDAYPGFTEPAIAAMETEAFTRFPVQDLMVVHRYGPIAPGEAIGCGAAAAEHRRAAFEAADFLMDFLKTRAPFWKKESGPDGERWIEPRPSDYDDALRWAPKQRSVSATKDSS